MKSVKYYLEEWMLEIPEIWEQYDAEFLVYGRVCYCDKCRVTKVNNNKNKEDVGKLVVGLLDIYFTYTVLKWSWYSWLKG